MSRKLGHAKSAHSEHEQLMNQVWHGLVDTIRLLPSVPTKAADSAAHESHTIDEALDKISLLISLRKGETVQPDRMMGHAPPVSIITPSTPTSTSSAGGGVGGGGVKRKRRGSYSVSPAPPPLPTAASFDSNLSSIASPAPASGAAVKDRSATPASMSRDQTGKSRKDVYAEQTQMQPGTRVAFKLPSDGGEEGWILAVVTRGVVGDKTRYEVQDLDDETKYKTKLSSLIMLPNAKSSAPLAPFPKDSIVLAVYPDTTSLYQATVIAAPTPKGVAGGKSDPRVNKSKYLLAFVDDDERVHEVDPHDVAHFPRSST